MNQIKSLLHISGDNFSAKALKNQIGNGLEVVAEKGELGSFGKLKEIYTFSSANIEALENQNFNQQFEYLFNFLQSKKQILANFELELDQWFSLIQMFEPFFYLKLSVSQLKTLFEHQIVYTQTIDIQNQNNPADSLLGREKIYLDSLQKFGEKDSDRTQLFAIQFFQYDDELLKTLIQHQFEILIQSENEIFACLPILQNENDYVYPLDILLEKLEQNFSKYLQNQASVWHLVADRGQGNTELSLSQIEKLANLNLDFEQFWVWKNE